MTTSIRNATAQDFAEIYCWLEAEEAKYLACSEAGNRKTIRGFFSNVDVIENAFKDKDLRVMAVDGRVVSFMAYGLTTGGVSETRLDERCKGYAKELVQDALRTAKENGKNALYIQCAPETSIPFWLKMGFRQYHLESSNESYASHVICRNFGLPDGGNPRNVRIQMFASEAKYNHDLSHPVMDSRLVGYSFGTKDVSLPQRVVFDARGLVPDNPHNAMVRIEVDDRELQFDRLRELNGGVERDGAGVHYIDIVRPRGISGD
ncbi:GNAT family N-acetyltransferase [Rhizobium leguminosarum]|uniref:GNAT family N-acetyltransferase n=1 Tax=Rhizobium leguminosarum TaxID=384 RepID=UPI001032165D|nr:GNAT family N-acetyltransferase [Rhizobium leguminosarum]TBG25382.1 GNAT family N-acetyltransferase [Rhizobium leguminosarum]